MSGLGATRLDLTWRSAHIFGHLKNAILVYLYPIIYIFLLLGISQISRDTGFLGIQEIGHVLACKKNSKL